jgi:metal-responsive CopG/Arc/MetJ family transcriptional regulator
MFGGGNKIKLEKDLLERIKVISKAAGYASHEEFIVHVLEKEIAKFDDAKSDEDITNKLKGLGYIS